MPSREPFETTIAALSIVVGSRSERLGVFELCDFERARAMQASISRWLVPFRS
jgi:hypothetical protein